MNKIAKDKLDKRRKETSLKSMYFNRFLLIRYITAVFFFTNLYWLCSLIMSNTLCALVPGITFIFIIRSVWEQCTMYSAPIDNAKKTILAYKVILAENVLLMITIFTPLFKELYPFLMNNTKSRGFILFINLIGAILCVISLNRLNKIKDQSDKQFKLVKQYEKKLKIK